MNKTNKRLTWLSLVLTLPCNSSDIQGCAPAWGHYYFSWPDRGEDYRGSWKVYTWPSERAWGGKITGEQKRCPETDPCSRSNIGWRISAALCHPGVLCPPTFLQSTSLVFIFQQCFLTVEKCTLDGILLQWNHLITWVCQHTWLKRSVFFLPSW